MAERSSKKHSEDSSDEHPRLEGISSRPPSPQTDEHATVRFMCLLSIGAFISFAAVDPFMTDGPIAPLLITRAICVFLGLLIFAATWSKPAKSHAAPLGGAVCLLTGWGVIALTALTGGPESLYWTMLMLTFFAVALLLPLSMVRAAVYFGTLALSYDLWMWHSGLTEPLTAWIASNAGIWLATAVSVLAVGFIDRLRQRQRESARRLATLNARLREEIRRRRDAQETIERTEAALRETQKLEAIGQLAAGVAHEFNNVLTSIIFSANMLESELAPGSSQRETLSRMNAAADRGATLTSSLLGFSRAHPKVREVFRSEDVVKDVIDVLEQTHRGRAAFTLQVSPSVLPLEGDPQLFYHAVLNMCLNAIDASDDTQTIDVTVRQATASERAELDDAPDAIAVEICDHGCGMSPAVLSRAFEPFFTTKPRGEGTGLGLSMVYGTVRGQGGLTSITSTEGKGTQVKVLMPCTDAPCLPSAAPSSLAHNLPSLSEYTVLLVDDDTALRELSERLLKQQNANVIAAPNGLEALERLQEHPNTIDIVVLDMVMPGLSGAETFVRVRDIVPDMPILLTSGFAESSELSELLRNQACMLLKKPFRPKALLEAMGSLLAMPREEAQPAKVLVVEDKAALRELTVALVESFGMNVESAATGSQALQTCATWSPDLILLDLRLPDATGFDVARQIKQQKHPYSPAIIAVSGSNANREEDLCKEAGINEFMLKPFTAKQLRQRLEQHLRS